jgi:putative NADH-flavin reductase
MPVLIAYLLYALLLTLLLAARGHGRRAPRPAPESPATPTRVLIIGVTGGTGRCLVTQALDRGLEVTALARDPSKLAIEHPRLRILKGDILDPASVQSAVRNQDAVLSALGHKRFLGPSSILSDGTRNLIRAMETHGVRRLVCETSLGIGSSAGRMGLLYTLFILPVVLPFYFYDKTRQERLIAASSLDWVIVRPAALTDDPGRGQCRSGQDIGSFLTTAKIPRADVARFMFDQLSDSSNLATSIGICS